MSWETDMQRATEEHLDAVWEYHLEAESALSDDELEDLGEDPAVGPFCGCTTCQVREALTIAIPHVAKAILAGEVKPEELIA